MYLFSLHLTRVDLALASLVIPTDFFQVELTITFVNFWRHQLI